MRADGRKCRKRIVLGIFPSLRASISAWSKAILARPPRKPVSITRNGALVASAMGGTPYALGSSLDSLRRSTRLIGQSAVELLADLADILSIQFERIGRDIAHRGIAVGSIAGGGG